MKTIEYYNIHNIIKFQINKKGKGLFWNFNPEYEYFRVKHIDKPDIVVNVGDFKPELKGSYIVDGNYYIKKDYIFFKDRDYNMEIRGIEECKPVEINIYPKPHGIRRLWPVLAIQNIFLRPLIEIVALKKNFIILHAASISDGGNAYLFAGRGGTGKTTIAMNLIKKGYHYMGEERILIGDSRAYSYPLNRRLFEFWLTHMSDEYSFPILYRLRAFRRLTSDTRFTLNITKDAKIKRIYLIKKQKGRNILKIEKTNNKFLVKDLVYNNLIDLEYGYMPFITGIRELQFNRLIYSYLFINKNSVLSEEWRNFASIVNNIFLKVEKYSCTLPEHPNNDTYQKVMAHIQDSLEE